MDKNQAPVDALAERIAQWKEQYGADNVYDMTPRDIEDGELKIPRIICRQPERKDLSRLAKGLAGDSLKALHALIIDCLLYPEREVIDQLLERRPGLIVSLGGALQEMAGVMTDFLPRKL